MLRAARRLPLGAQRAAPRRALAAQPSRITALHALPGSTRDVTPREPSQAVHLASVLRGASSNVPAARPRGASSDVPELDADAPPPDEDLQPRPKNSKVDPDEAKYMVKNHKNKVEVVRCSSIPEIKDACLRWNDLPHICVAGESNAGKSSLINHLLNKQLAKSSSVPGKTKTVDLMRINDKLVLVDLPGLPARDGQIEKDWKKTFQTLINAYIVSSKPRLLLFAHDIRWGISDFVKDFFQGMEVMPRLLVLTKDDSLKEFLCKDSDDDELANAIEHRGRLVMSRGIRRALRFKGLQLHYSTQSLKSALARRGRRKLLRFIESCVNAESRGAASAMLDEAAAKADYDRMVISPKPKALRKAKNAHLQALEDEETRFKAVKDAENARLRAQQTAAEAIVADAHSATLARMMRRNRKVEAPAEPVAEPAAEPAAADLADPHAATLARMLRRNGRATAVDAPVAAAVDKAFSEASLLPEAGSLPEAKPKVKHSNLRFSGAKPSDLKLTGAQPKPKELSKAERVARNKALHGT
ncbi:hypothetical protein M885DRAFT_587222 [Pelagophyceae sp. CCMP2097]|nr:hypothetical protein M885DRAFT_587222 [Pelagophyceae sp. CCMP2097]